MAKVYYGENGYLYPRTVSRRGGYASEDTLTRKANKLVNGKSIVVYVILAFFFGIYGVHRLYAGKIGSGVTMLLMSTVGFFLIVPVFISGVWAFVDLIIGIFNLSTPEKIFRRK